MPRFRLSTCREISTLPTLNFQHNAKNRTASFRNVKNGRGPISENFKETGLG
jgi:hypothetical protein